MSASFHNSHQEITKNWKFYKLSEILAEISVISGIPEIPGGLDRDSNIIIIINFISGTGPYIHIKHIKHTQETHETHKSLKDTKKLCYRKDDRAMRPTYGCPEIFWDSLTKPTATPNIIMGFCSDRPYESRPPGIPIVTSLGHVTSSGACPNDRPWALFYRLSI